MLELLDFEVAQANNDASIAGWTSYAIIIAIGLVSWQAISMIEAELLSWRSIIILLWSFCWMTSPFELLGGNVKLSLNTISSSPRVVWLSSYLSSLKYTIFLSALKSIFVIVVTLYIGNMLFQFTYIYLVTINIVELVIISLSLLLIKFDQPFLLSARANANVYYNIAVVYIVIRILLEIVIIYDGVTLLYESNSGIVFSEFKFAILIATLYWLFGKYANYAMISPKITRLREIRRSLSLRLIDENAARNELGLLVGGLSIDEAFRVKMQQISSEHDEIARQIDKMILGSHSIMSMKDALIQLDKCNKYYKSLKKLWDKHHALIEQLQRLIASDGGHDSDAMIIAGILVTTIERSMLRIKSLVEVGQNTNTLEQ